MKAAVLRQLGTTPVYSDFTEPVPQSDDQIILNVKAAALKNLDKIRAKGGHYASYRELPVVVGNDGVGILGDGRRVYAQGLTGMMAEKALVAKDRVVVLPDGLDLSLAAALPNAVIGSALALHTRAKIKSGDVVLINGATGVTGQLAVQVAKHFGASKVIATGRNKQALEKLKALGADEVIALGEDDQTFIHTLKEIGKRHPLDIVIDYLWARPTELIIESLKVEGFNASPHKVKIVTVGDMAGHSISLSSGILRSADIEIVGSGLGTFLPKELMEFNTKLLPEMFTLAAEGRLTLETDNERLSDIENVWHKDANWKRTVIIID